MTALLLVLIFEVTQSPRPQLAHTRAVLNTWADADVQHITVRTEEDVLPRLIQLLQTNADSTVSRPVAVFHGNVCRFQAATGRLMKHWVRRWVASSLPVWCTGVIDLPPLARWWHSRVLATRTTPSTDGPVPVWGVFSGTADALLILLTASAPLPRQCTPPMFLERLRAANQLHIDCAPLLEWSKSNLLPVSVSPAACAAVVSKLRRAYPRHYYFATGAATATLITLVVMCCVLLIALAAIQTK